MPETMPMQGLMAWQADAMVSEWQSARAFPREASRVARPAPTVLAQA
jgi:hypothetical protein